MARFRSGQMVWQAPQAPEPLCETHRRLSTTASPMSASSFDFKGTIAPVGQTSPHFRQRVHPFFSGTTHGVPCHLPDSGPNMRMHCGSQASAQRVQRMHRARKRSSSREPGGRTIPSAPRASAGKALPARNTWNADRTPSDNAARPHAAATVRTKTRRPGPDEFLPAADFRVSLSFSNIVNGLGADRWMHANRLWITDARPFAKSTADACLGIDNGRFPHSGRQCDTFQRTSAHTSAARSMVVGIAEMFVDFGRPHANLGHNRFGSLVNGPQRPRRASGCAKQVFAELAIAQHACLTAREDDGRAALARPRPHGKIFPGFFSESDNRPVRASIGATPATDTNG